MNTMVRGLLNASKALAGSEGYEVRLGAAVRELVAMEDKALPDELRWRVHLLVRGVMKTGSIESHVPKMNT
jgi:hypothetical protein